MHRRARAAVFTAILAGGGHAHAGGLDLDLFNPRSIGRAGTATVSGDGGAALLVNPAGMARRPEPRIQLGVAVHDDDARYRAPDSDASNTPTIVDRGGPVTTPLLAAHASLGPVVLGAVFLDTGRLDRVLPAPDSDQQPADVARLFPHRYGGLEVDYRRRVLAIGAAARLGEWLGLGASIGAADVEVGERRRLWAGFSGRGDEIGSPDRDVDLALIARDRLVPMASAGVLVAPPQLPIEMGASFSWSADAYPDGDARVGRAGGGDFPQPLNDGGQAELRLGSPNTLRTGVRYLGERVIVEVGAELVWLRAAGKTPVWRTRGVAVADESGVEAEVTRVPSLLARRDHAVVRGALDVEVVPGLLWLTGGYAFATAGTAPAYLSPVHGDTGGHTLAIGAEAAWNQVTFTLGYARLLAPAVSVSDSVTAIAIENPFDGGTAPAGAGRYQRAHDAFGLVAEIAWE